MTNKIYRYDANQKLLFPKTETEQVIIDLGVIDGKRYLSATDTITFEEEFEEVDLTSEDGLILKDQIKKESSECKRIDEETIRKIREKYDINEELKALRTNDTEYTAFVESVVQESKDKKEKLGL